MLLYLREWWETTSTAGKILRAILLILSGCLLYGVYWVTSNLQGDAPDSPVVAKRDRSTHLHRTIQETEEAGEAVLPLGVAERAVLDRHFSVIGGIDAIANVSSIRFSGKVIFQGGPTQELTVVKKGGNRMRISVRNNVSQTSIALSPDDNWRAVWYLENLVDVRDLSPSEVTTHRNYIYVVSELFLAMENGWDLNYLGQKDFFYKMAHVFEVRPNPRHTVRFYIDPETFLDIGREDLVFGSDGSLEINQRVNSNHFQTNRLTLPGKVSTYINNELVQTLIIDRAELNSGVLNDVFARPVVATP